MEEGLTPMPLVKICGNTNAEDALLAAEYGADFLGFIFAESKRRIAPAEARKTIKKMPDFRGFVGVFFNQAKKEVLSIAEDLGLRYLQFHGDETALYCQSFSNQGFEVIKTFRIKDSMSLRRLDEYNVSAFLFDTFSREEKGGTGKPFDWNLIADKPFVHEKLFLAGGLNVRNLAEAVKKIRPYAVDVASGVEASPGVKDPELMKEFIMTAKEAGGANARKKNLHS